MEKKTFTLGLKDVERLDVVREFHGYPSRSETIRRVIEREVEKIREGENA